MPAALADHAAALAEGYVRVQVDFGASAPLRYLSRYEKPIDCDASSGCLRQIPGWGTSQAVADTNALNALNGVRAYVYGTDATNINKGTRSGQTAVVGRH